MGHMPRSFRFEPPEPRPGSLTRPRLLRALLGRWEHRVTTVVGGPGLGKTTLLAQAVAENRLAARGTDLWIGLGPADADGGALARDTLAALARLTDGRSDEAVEVGVGDEPSAVTVADAVWRLSPTAICLVFDDAHVLGPGSPGARWLAELIDALPANGHVLLASRWAPAVPLARLATQGDVLRLTEDDLRFSDDELTGFAARRGVDVERFEDSGGWPAMAELAASVERDLAGDYLWEEVLEPLGAERRRVLAVVSDLGGADDRLASAALGMPVELARVLDGVPLVAHGAGGWRVPHPLWRSVRALAVSHDERGAVRRRAVVHLTEEHRYDDAVTLAAEAGLDDLVAGVLRAASIGPERPPTRWLDRWLADLPPAARGTAGATLAAGVRASAVAPAEATEPLRTAIDLCRADGDIEGELSALAVLGRVAWWRSDIALLGEIYPRVLELEAEGHALARAIARLGRAVLADIAGDDDAAIAHLDGIEPGVLDEAWQAVGSWLKATVLAGAGRADEAVTILDGIPTSPDPAFRLTVEGARLAAMWSQGHVDEVVAALPSIVERIRSAGVVQNLFVALSQGAIATASVGDADAAERYLAQARQAGRDTGVDATARLALGEAATLLAAGDEAGATTVLDKVIASHGIDPGIDRRVWRNSLSLSYVLVPASRAYWDAADLRGHVAVARRLAAAVAAQREGGRGLRDLEVPAAAEVRAALHHRFCVELALDLEAAGRPEGGALLESLGTRGRDAVRAVAAERTRQTKPARSLLAAVPAPPSRVTDLAVLGALEITRDGTAVTDGDLRRERVRALLSFLVGHRATSRAAITAALWPDLDESAAANNLRVTMSYLKRLLEPWRAAKDPSYFVRLEGQSVCLVTGDWLRIDADRFDDHIARAARAEADGTPSVALEHSLAAVDLYRGPAHQGVVDADWIDLEREHYRTRFVAAATRAGELLVGRGDIARAEQVARRAVDVDPWAEDAYGVLVASALARGDRSAARCSLDRALAALAELGVEPSEQLRQLRRRVRGGAEPA
jgi:ATP/maltotriose-dependent transcriptional regulator MalT/DNA-binding SARP family transcriptional activator